MIKKLTSEQFMNILEEAQESISSTKDKVNDIKNKAEAKINLINNIIDYNQYRIDKMLARDKTASSTKFLLIDSDEKSGSYSEYGIEVHPKIKKSTNVLNFATPDGYVYKNNATVSINKVEDVSYNNMLIHDTIADKDCFFKEYDTDFLEIQVTINPTALLGSTKTNIIELMPYLPGSFNINDVQIFTMQDYKTMEENVPTYTINQGMLSAGSTRIFLENKLDIWKIIFHVTLKYKNQANKYPFGMKHIYLLNADMVTDSYINIRAETDNVIKYISEDLIITDQYGERESTCEKEGIKLYANNNGGELSYEIMTSKGLTLNALTKNTREFFIHIPLNKSIISIKFKNITPV